MRKMMLCGAFAFWLAAAMASLAAQGGPAGAVFNASGELLRPDYREWVFVASSLGMTYGPEATAGTQFFQNIYVSRDAYRQFIQNGTWPEGTTFILEGRQPIERASIDNRGRTQGEVVFVEASVKDSGRFASTNGWGYFRLGAGQRARSSAAPLSPATESCYACHAENTAVDNTFVQFYPDLFAAARQHRTIKPTYDPAKKLVAP